MSVRTEWALAREVHLELVDEHTDAYGTTLSEGNVGLSLSMDDVIMIEGTLEEIKDLGSRILAAVGEKDGDYRCRGCGRPELDCSKDPCPGVIADRES